MIQRIRYATVVLILSLMTQSPTAGAARLGSTATLAAGTRVAGAVKTGQMAPEFRLTGLDGKAVALKDLRGRVVLIDFWASWCGPCRYSMPHIERLYREFKGQGLVVLGINIEDPEDARAFLERNHYTFRMLSDADGVVAEAYGVEAIPTTLIINREGRVVGQHVGVEAEETLRADLRRAGLYDGQP